MKKLNLEAFKALQVTATEKIEGGLKVTGSGKGTVDLLWDSGHQDCDVPTSSLGLAYWDGSGRDPYL